MNVTNNITPQRYQNNTTLMYSVSITASKDWRLSCWQHYPAGSFFVCNGGAQAKYKPAEISRELDALSAIISVVNFHIPAIIAQCCEPSCAGPLSTTYELGGAGECRQNKLSALGGPADAVLWFKSSEATAYRRQVKEPRRFTPTERVFSSPNYNQAN